MHVVNELRLDVGQHQVAADQVVERVRQRHFPGQQNLNARPAPSKNAMRGYPSVTSKGSNPITSDFRTSQMMRMMMMRKFSGMRSRRNRATMGDQHTRGECHSHIERFFTLPAERDPSSKHMN